MKVQDLINHLSYADPNSVIYFLDENGGEFDIYTIEHHETLDEFYNEDRDFEEESGSVLLAILKDVGSYLDDIQNLVDLGEI